jgi:hypothetical protein
MHHTRLLNYAITDITPLLAFPFSESGKGCLHHALSLSLSLQVLAFAQQSRERSNYEQAALLERMQEFKRQIDRESRWSPNGMNDSPNGDGIQTIGRSSHKMIEEAMQSASKGKVTGYWNYPKTIFMHAWLCNFI